MSNEKSVSDVLTATAVTSPSPSPSTLTFGVNVIELLEAISFNESHSRCAPLWVRS